MLPPALPARLYLETRDLHAAAERAGAMGELLHGRLALPRYRALLRNLLAIYRPLEAALDACRALPQVAPLYLPALYRAAALQRDLDALGAAPDAAPVTAAAAAYGRRVEALALAASPALVAHAYVRYLGDLNGGQVLRRVVARQYGVGPAATQFYDFGGDAAVAAQRAAYRVALAAVPATPAEATLIVAEARWAFEQHLRLFEQLMDAP